MRDAGATFQFGSPFGLANAYAGTGSLGRSQSLVSGQAALKGAENLEQRVVELYDTLRPSLYRYLISIGIASQDVEEIVQETFLRLYRHMCDGGNEENLRAWIYQVAHNLSSNVLKSRRRLVEITPEFWETISQSMFDRAPGPEEQLLLKERFVRVHERLARLTQLQRDCLYLRVEGFRYREIGEMLSVGTSTVSSSLRNAIQRLVKECL